MSTLPLTKRFVSAATILILGLALTVTNRQAHADGNLTVQIEDGVLWIGGDRQSNQIIVSELDGYYLIGGSGSDYPRDYCEWVPPWWDHSPGTTVNGINAPIILNPEEATDITDIVIIAGGGDDYVLLFGDYGSDTTDTSLWIDTGAGRDVANFNSLPVGVHGDLFINTGQDDDDVFGEIQVDGDVEISTGHGVDVVGFFASQINGNVNINTGVDDDVLFATDDNVVCGNLRVDMGQGDDVVGRFFNFGLPKWTILGFGHFSGGQGLDRLDPANITIDPAKLSIVGFELP